MEALLIRNNGIPFERVRHIWVSWSTTAYQYTLVGNLCKTGSLWAYLIRCYILEQRQQICTLCPKMKLFCKTYFIYCTHTWRTGGRPAGWPDNSLGRSRSMVKISEIAIGGHSPTDLWWHLVRLSAQWKMHSYARQVDAFGSHGCRSRVIWWKHSPTKRLSISNKLYPCFVIISGVCLAEIINNNNEIMNVY